MSTPPTEATPKRARRRFQTIPVPVPGPSALPNLKLDQPVLAELLPNSTLETLASQTGAQDQRKRKLTCVVFFWLMVLAVGPGGPLSLATLVSFLVVACVLAAQAPTADAETVSKQALSDNLKLRPWQFFAAVLKQLLAAYAVLVGSAVPTLDLDLIHHLTLVDSTTLRVADCLIQRFPARRTGRKVTWAAAKLHVALRLFHSIPQVLALTAEKVNDKKVDFLRPKGEKALYVFDLGYWKYLLFDTIIERDQHFVSRLRDDCNPLIKQVDVGSQAWVGQRLKDITLSGPAVDLRVHLAREGATTAKMKHDVRLVGQLHEEVWYLYITSILERPHYSVEVIVQLYALRWQIEIFFRDLKCVLHIENFIATTENGVRIQIYAALIFYVLTHLIMLKAAQQVATPMEQMSVPKCLTAVGQALTQMTDLVRKGREPDWRTVEEHLVAIICAVYRRPNPKRKKPSRLAQAIAALVVPKTAPTAGIP